MGSEIGKKLNKNTNISQSEKLTSRYTDRETKILFFIKIDGNRRRKIKSYE